MQRMNFYLSLSLIALGLILVFWVIPSQSASGERYGLPPSTLPIACTVLIIVFSVLLMFQNRPGTWDKKEAGANPLTPRILRHIALYFGISIAGVLTMKYLGFTAGGVLTIAAAMISAGRHSPLSIAIWALGAPAALYIVLWYGLRMPLP